MDNLLITETAHTPFVCMDLSTGTMEIKGRSIPDDADSFWMPVLSWFESYRMDPFSETTFIIYLEYFNIASSKRILFLLYKLNDMIDDGFDVRVEWHYRESDEEMFEVGNDYAYMVRVPFEFKALQELDLASA